MRLQSSDTNPEAEKVLINLIQSKSIPERPSRLELLSSLTNKELIHKFYSILK